MKTTDPHALVGAYVLNAVDDLERAGFERHVADCESCRLELRELRETAARLADNTWSVPPPGMRSEVLAAIGRTRQLPPSAKAPQPKSDPRTAVTRWRRLTVVAAAASILVAGVGATTWAVQQQRIHEKSSAIAVIQLRENQTKKILSATDLVVRTAPMIGGGRVTVASSALQGASLVSLRAERATATDRALQMWTILGTGPARNAGLLPAGENSGVEIVQGVPGNDVFAVSVEPAKGSLSPTVSEIVAKVPLT